MEAEISGPDLIRVENVNFLLSQIDAGHNPQFIEQTMQNVMLTMGIPEFWTAVESLAEALLQKNDKKLGRTEIETILRANGFLDYIKDL